MELSKILNDATIMMVDCTVAPVSPVALSLAADGVRVGKWTEEEERFALELIKYFSAGALVLTTGTSLRSFLAKKLRCSPMRISTKLSMDTLGGERIPKKLGQKRFFPMDTVTDLERRQIASELTTYELAFLQKENLELDVSAVDSNGSDSSGHSDDDLSDDNAPVRIGSWSDEEQVYAAALIDAFLRGMLQLPQGTTLRAFLADRLCCNPMRISKKLATGMMANQALPKRLGSAAFQQARGLSHVEIALKDHELARLRGACFSSTGSPSNSPSYMTPRNASQQMMVAPQPLSPVNTGMKRLGSEVRNQLPPLSETCKKARLLSCAYTIQLS